MQPPSMHLTLLRLLPLLPLDPRTLLNFLSWSITIMTPPTCSLIIIHQLVGTFVMYFAERTIVLTATRLVPNTHNAPVIHTILSSCTNYSLSCWTYSRHFICSFPPSSCYIHSSHSHNWHPIFQSRFLQVVWPHHPSPEKSSRLPSPSASHRKREVLALQEGRAQVTRVSEVKRPCHHQYCQDWSTGTQHNWVSLSPSHQMSVPCWWSILPCPIWHQHICYSLLLIYLFIYLFIYSDLVVERTKRIEEIYIYLNPFR